MRYRHAWEHPADRKRRRRKLACWLFVILLGAFGLYYDAAWARHGWPSWDIWLNWMRISGARPATLLQQEETQVHFIDVGQGDAVLLEQSDHFALIDAGSDQYSEQLICYLKRIGVERLELLVMTHPDRDHIGSMDEVLQEFAVDRLWIPNFSKHELDDPLYVPHILSQATRQGTEIRIPQPGEMFVLGDGMITLLNDGVDSAQLPENAGYNDLSLCLRFDVGDFSYLGTGDCEAAGEQQLLELGCPLQADVCKAGHHGSSSSNTVEFLQAVQPKVMVACCGRQNRYGHPHAEVRNRLAMAGIPLYRTDRHGNVVVIPDEDGDPVVYTENEIE